MLEPQQLAKSNQEQAVAAWVNYLNQLRLDNLLNTFRQQDVNLEDALASVDEAIRKIDLEVVAANRGGVKGMHGFIAEVAEEHGIPYRCTPSLLGALRSHFRHLRRLGQA